MGTESLQRPNISGLDNKRLFEGVYPDLEKGNGPIDNGVENLEQPRKLRLMLFFDSQRLKKVTISKIWQVVGGHKSHESILGWNSWVGGEFIGDMTNPPRRPQAQVIFFFYVSFVFSVRLWRTCTADNDSFSVLKHNVFGN